ncbi:unnamed protein product [Rangifer tarandus platyrhynchus]|uniref:Uncharacterized protein n=2 Tax=Rangifer tarandus platyrhynchus TaxID=3082113 RepID=A0ABN8Y3Z7_RANTA|nr:unnamed protein product [Rangifer tarandus platyrhynchus]CAI9692783.1 unnamed protein product [Rangifer tarandus platyrhynchus]
MGNHPLGNPQTKAGGQALRAGQGAASGTRTEHAKEDYSRAVIRLGCEVSKRLWAPGTRLDRAALGVPTHSTRAGPQSRKPEERKQHLLSETEKPHSFRSVLQRPLRAAYHRAHKRRRKGPIHGCRAGPEEGIWSSQTMNGSRALSCN